MLSASVSQRSRDDIWKTGSNDTCTSWNIDDCSAPMILIVPNCMLRNIVVHTVHYSGLGYEIVDEVDVQVATNNTG